jgi:hypothetical protein
MKKRILFAVLTFLSFTVFAQQTKYALLDAKNPLIGDWEWISNDTGSAASPVSDQVWMYLHFAAGTEQSFGATSWDEERGFTCTSQFLAFSNGAAISTTLSTCCNPSEKGTKFSFTYEYDAGSDQLIVTVRGEKSYYKRKK